MECSEVRKILFENPEMDFPADIDEGIKSHLAECRGCAAQLHALQAQSQALKSMPKLRAPVGFLDEVQRQVEKGSPLRRIRKYASSILSSGQLLKLAGAATAAVLVVVTLQSVYRGGSNQAPVLTPSPQAQAPVAEPAPPQMPTLRGGMQGNASSKLMAPKAAAPQVSGAAVAAPREIIISLGAREKQHSEEARVSASALPEKKEKTFSASAQPERMAKSAVGRERSAAPAPAPPGTFAVQRNLSIQDAVAEAKRIVASLGGTVQAEEKPDQAESPRELDARISAENYPALLDRLRSIGAVTGGVDEGMPLSPTVHLKLRFTDNQS